MRRALRLAARGYGHTSPNPMVSAVVVRDGEIIGEGWHHRAGLPHAEIEAIRDCEHAGRALSGTTLYVTLEPCSTTGRTPPCSEAIIKAGFKRVVVAATDPNPAHAGRGFEILRRAGIDVSPGVLASEAAELNAAFNHWIVNKTPLVTVKSGMSLDGKIATNIGASRWITGERSRGLAMKLRAGADAILVGVKTIIADDPSLTVRLPGYEKKRWNRIVLDPRCRTPLDSKVVQENGVTTIIVATKQAPAKKLKSLARRARVIQAPTREGKIDLNWLARKLGEEQITSLLVEGGGETNAAFLEQKQAHFIAFFYAPMIIGGRNAPKSVAGIGLPSVGEAVHLREPRWRKLGTDLMLSARVEYQGGAK